MSVCSIDVLSSVINLQRSESRQTVSRQSMRRESELLIFEILILLVL